MEEENPHYTPQDNPPTDSPEPTDDGPLRILHHYWHYPQFRGVQREIIDSVLAGRDTLGLMPTGGGKSLTFQVPALLKDGVTIVITPLIALMKDQVDRLRRMGIQASAIYSSLSREQILQILDNAVLGGVKLLYISPERIATQLFESKLRHIKVSLITVDEAHCISQWGYDFRPSYLKISDIRKMKPGVPVLALTATATPQVVDDIQQLLGFLERNVFQMSFKRDNLAYVVRETEDKRTELVHILSSVEGCAIVYARTRRNTREIADMLNANNITATFYHAGLRPSVKDERQAQWQNDEVRVMVATNAFGMGIDKPDVRLVVHTDCPDCIEAYFQEAGRAGRDGKKAYAILLHDGHDDYRLRMRVATTFPDKEFILEVYDHLAYFFQIAEGSGCGVTHLFDIERFCHAFRHFPVTVNSALLILQRCGYIKYEPDPDSKARIRFLPSRDQLYRIDTENPVDSTVITTLMRLYGGMFVDYTPIELPYIAQRAGLTNDQVYNSLRALTRRGIVDFIPQSNSPYITYTRQRSLSERMVIPAEVYDIRKKLFAEKIEEMIHYANADECRSRMLLAYFGETESADCGQCDVCLEKKRNELHSGKQTDACQAVIDLLSDGRLHSLEELKALSCPADELYRAVDRMIKEERIVAFDDGVKLVSH